MIVVVLICGIPASGKSTLSRLLSTYYDNNNCHMISFDDDEVSSLLWSDETFRISRRTSLSKLREILISINSKDSSSITNDNIDNIIIIDDIMYLHSMRREVYVICRDNYATLLVVHVNIDVDVALTRNAKRSSENQQYVNEDTIKRLYQRFEGPSNTQIADKHSIVLTSNNDNDTTTNTLIIQKKITELKASATIRTYNHNNDDANINTNNIIHDIDVSIRKLIAETYRSIITDNKLKKDLVSIFGNAKSYTLLEAKQDISNDINADSNTIMSTYLLIWLDKVSTSLPSSLLSDKDTLIDSIRSIISTNT